MTFSSSLLAFTLASVLLVVLPGPSVLFIVGRSLAGGRKAGVATVLGVDLGLLVLSLAVALGMGAIISASELLYQVIKVLGAAYLVYLGINAIRHRKDSSAEPHASDHRLAGIGKSFIVGVTNPKTLAIGSALFPQFVVASAVPAPVQMMVYAVVFWLMAMAADCVWALAAGSVRTWFASSQQRQQHFATAGGVMMIVLGGVLAVTKRP